MHILLNNLYQRLFVVVGILLLSTSIVRAEPASDKSIREYLKISGQEEAAIEYMRSMIPAFRQMVKGMPEDLISELTRTDNMVEQLIPIYQKYFTEEDMLNLIAFYKTSTGKKMARVLSPLQTDIIERGARESRMAYMDYYIQKGSFTVQKAVNAEPITLSAKVLDFGIVGFSAKQRIETPGSTNGKRVAIKKPFIKKTTDKIPIERDLAYAIKYELLGEPEGKEITINVVERSEQGLCKDRTTGQITYKTNSLWKRTVGEVAYNGGLFDEKDPCPDLPGIRTLELWFEEKLLLTKEFQLYK